MYASAGFAQQTLRVATLHTGLKHPGPGLLLRAIQKGDNPQVLMVRDMIIAIDPDIILLTRFDYDLELVALNNFVQLLAASGASYPYTLSLAPNSGVATGRDLDGDGWLGGAGDALGYGEFSGQGGMAILSRYPIDSAHVRDLSATLWDDGSYVGQALSSVGHWDVPVRVPGWEEPLRLLAYHAGTPAFDGPEGQNARRNADENQFWLEYLDGAHGVDVPIAAFVILGDSNLDPSDGEGQSDVMAAILNDDRLQDPQPTSAGAVEAARVQRGPNSQHSGDPALDTADFRDAGGPGNLRVDYVLPSADLTVLASGVFWPAIDEPQAKILDARQVDVSWHGLVWADIAR